MTKKLSKAFSLIELSIVILIIGVLIAAAGQGLDLLRDARVAAAQMLTQSSRVGSLKNLILWLETANSASIANSEMVDGGTVSTWYDNNPQMRDKNNATQATDANRPTYLSNCVNSLPCLKFDGVADFLDSTQNMNITTKEVSIFVVANATNIPGATDSTMPSLVATRSVSGGNWSDGDFNLRIFYSTLDYQMAGGYDARSMTIFPNQNYIFEVVDNGTVANTYINGSLGPTPAAVTGVIKIIKLLEIGAVFYDNFPRGRYFGGSMSEVIVFDRALSIKERVAVESYLSKKWGIKTN